MVWSADGQWPYYGNMKCSPLEFIGFSLLIKSLKYSNMKKCCKFTIFAKVRGKKLWLNSALHGLVFFFFALS